MNRPRVLVLGAGFIGEAVSRALLDKGCTVSVLTRSTLGEAHLGALAGATVAVGDAGDMGTLASMLADIDEVIYAVGSSSPVESELDPAGDISVVVPPLVRLLELIRLRPSVRLTFFSSGGAVYGNQDVLPISESASTHPISSYGIIKLTCERYVQMYAHSFGVRAIILRTGNAYGPGQPITRGQGVVARLLRSAITGEPVALFGMAAMRDYVFIDDLALVAADLVCRAEVPRVLNVGTGVGHTLRDVLEIARNATGAAIRVRELEPRAFDVATNVLDVSALRATIDFDPLNLEDGIKTAWKYVSGLSTSEQWANSPPRAPGMYGQTAEAGV